MRFALFTLFMCAGLGKAQIPTPRQEVLEAQHARPTDPWPRGRGHVVLALPGSLEVQKSYHEPGGSFSPEFRSFGVSFWVTDSHGAILETGDSMPLSQIRQRFVWHDGVVAPSIRTETGEYVANWSVGPALGHSQLLLTPRLSLGHKLMLAIRSVGPAGAAIESLAWTNNELIVNGRYRLRITPSPVSVYVGHEGGADWTTATAGSSTECHGQNGWCFARLELPSKSNTSLHIVDAYPRRAPELTARSTRSTLEIALPDDRFRDSLDAQVAHLMMGTVDDQTRPGEPNQYPLAWLRDGAYQVVALARAGQLDEARELVHYFVDKDFFGGFGAEGDAPGLSLWAMEEVAVRLNSRDYDRFLWPHVYRKAEFILGMKSTKETIQRIFAGMLVPIHRAEPDVYDLAQPASDGLIRGRMDLHYPAMYATAESYNGLLKAAELADRLNIQEDARRWRAAAAELKRAWNAAYQPTEPDDRTFMSGLWPTWIDSDRATYLKGLDLHWAAGDSSSWDDARGGFRVAPLWTYFTFAFAHQYLFLDKPERTFPVLQWFWEHQPSPGLYSWWEGNGEENNFHEWEYVRGWVDPPHVTPHYWAAAECLLLQMDMLTYVEETLSEPVIVVGAGIPASWTLKPMKVHGMLTKLGRVDWTWDGKAMLVNIQGKRVPVRLGSSFPSGAKVTVLSTASDRRRSETE
jgi:hypothetical protein